MPLGLDKTYLGSNSWLSGFIDTDGNFHCEVSRDSKGICNKIKYYMRITQRASYHRVEKGFNVSYLPVMEDISKFLAITNVTTITRKRENFIEHAYGISTVSKNSSQILIKYLEVWPLFSSKHLDYLNWSAIAEISINKRYKELSYSEKVIFLKGSMNNGRISFNWDHLKNFYTK